MFSKNLMALVSALALCGFVTGCNSSSSDSKPASVRSAEDGSQGEQDSGQAQGDVVATYDVTATDAYLEGGGEIDGALDDFPGLTADVATLMSVTSVEETDTSRLILYSGESSVLVLHVENGSVTVEDGMGGSTIQTVAFITTGGNGEGQEQGQEEAHVLRFTLNECISEKEQEQEQGQEEKDVKGEERCLTVIVDLYLALEEKEQEQKQEEEKPEEDKDQDQDQDEDKDQDQDQDQDKGDEKDQDQDQDKDVKEEEEKKEEKPEEDKDQDQEQEEKPEEDKDQDQDQDDKK